MHNKYCNTNNGKLDPYFRGRTSDKRHAENMAWLEKKNAKLDAEFAAIEAEKARRTEFEAAWLDYIHMDHTSKPASPA